MIAILAVLMSLLSPSLQRVMYKANLTQCSLNFKSLGIAMTLYTEDNNGYYVNHRGINQPRTYYDDLDHLTGRDDSQAPMHMMLPYFGSKEDWWKIVICPFVDDEEIWETLTVGGEGFRAPSYHDNSMPILMYSNVEGRDNVGIRPNVLMKRIGDRWNWGDSPTSTAGEQGRSSSGPSDAVHDYYNILMADRLWGASHSNNETVMNHNPPGVPLMKLGNWGDGGNHYRGYSVQAYSAFYTYEANYLFDDGSVKFYDGIQHRPSPNSDYLRFRRGGWVPVETGRPQ